MKITFDVATRQLELDAADMTPTGGRFSAMINRHGRRILFSRMSFGLIVESDAVEIARFTFPPIGTKYTQTDQDLILSDTVSWAADDNLILRAWMENDGERVERIWYLTAPRPEQPYPSWTWDGGAWVPPVPAPAGDYTWNETDLAWIAVETGA